MVAFLETTSTLHPVVRLMHTGIRLVQVIPGGGLTGFTSKYLERSDGVSPRLGDFISDLGQSWMRGTKYFIRRKTEGAGPCH